MSTSIHPAPNVLPRVGVPWRTSAEEAAENHRQYDAYLAAVRDAGGDPVPVSLSLPDAELATLAQSLDAILLTGSPADVEPRRYGSARHTKTAAADAQRERTDDLLLEDAFATGKPVLAICYGTQLLNVHFGGSLVQDIPSELRTSIDHAPAKQPSEPLHPVNIEPFEDGCLFEIATSLQSNVAFVRADASAVNSSHHQSVCEPGRGLRITARSPDGVVEAIEWAGESTTGSTTGSADTEDGASANEAPARRRWIVGVQWHPERMRGDVLSRALFRKLVSEAREVRYR